MSSAEHSLVRCASQLRTKVRDHKKIVFFLIPGPTHFIAFGCLSVDKKKRHGKAGVDRNVLLRFRRHETETFELLNGKTGCT